MALCNNSIGYVTYMHMHVETQMNAFPLYTYIYIYTVFPQIVCARSINFTAVMLRGQFEGAV